MVSNKEMVEERYSQKDDEGMKLDSTLLEVLIYCLFLLQV